MDTYYIGDRGFPPPALRLIVYGADPDLPFCETFLPLPGDTLEQFCARVHNAARVWHQIRAGLIVQTHCVYELPANPAGWDLNWMVRKRCLAMAEDHRNSASVRLNAIRLSNRLERLVPVEV